MKIGHRIKKNRNARNLTQQQLAEKAKISRSYLADLEGDRYNPSLETLEKLAEALEVSTERLTGKSLSCIIEERIEEKGMTLEEVAEKTGVSLTWLQNIDTFIPGYFGNFEIGYIWITRVAEAIGLPGAQLRAALARQEIPTYDGPQSTPEEDFEFITVETPKAEYSIYPNSTRIPVLGDIPAGLALEAVEDIVGWEEIPEDWLNGDREYFGLIVRGDSMYPEYLENDVVIIRKQNCCDSGDDCAVILDGENATLKRVYILEDGIELRALNKMHGKKKFTNKEVETLPVTILGVVVELRRKKK